MNEYKTNVTFDKLEKALTAFGAMVEKPMQDDRSNIDATIQRFKYSIELFWKLLKRLLEDKGVVDIRYPKDVLTEAYSGRLIDHEDMWLQMLRDRNSTSHAYDEAMADEIYYNVKHYYPLLVKTFHKLKKKEYDQI